MYKVERIEAENFSRVWNKRGIGIILTPEAIDFAVDFSNVVLRNFIEMCQEQFKKQQAIQEPKKLIIEGID